MTPTQVNLICACGHTTSHNCHASWKQSRYLQPSTPDRHTVDTLKDPELHRLYDERDMYARDWALAQKRAEQAEAELAENTGVLQALRRQRDGAEADLKHAEDRAEQAEAQLAQARKDWGYATGLLIQAVEQLPAGSVRDRIRDTLGEETR